MQAEPFWDHASTGLWSVGVIFWRALKALASFCKHQSLPSSSSLIKLDEPPTTTSLLRQRDVSEMRTLETTGLVPSSSTLCVRTPRHKNRGSRACVAGPAVLRVLMWLLVRTGCAIFPDRVWGFPSWRGHWARSVLQEYLRFYAKPKHTHLFMNKSLKMFGGNKKKGEWNVYRFGTPENSCCLV